MGDEKPTDAVISDIVAKLLDEYAENTAAIQKLELRRGRIRAALLPLVAIEENVPAEFAGSLADACRLVLQQRDGSLTPQQVRDAVKALGYNLSQHDNVMATIHGVLKSLVSQGVVTTKEWKREPGVTRYLWNPDVTVPLKGVKGVGRLGSIFTPPGTVQVVGPLMDVTAGNPADLIARLEAAIKPKKDGE